MRLPSIEDCQGCSDPDVRYVGSSNRQNDVRDENRPVQKKLPVHQRWDRFIKIILKKKLKMSLESGIHNGVHLVFL